ncbi:hypothetical protein TEA_015823 [Camellia sinensis var. sinensis]|uniref:PsbP C-terminal domain-containing protein n=1 Tax=Camellia sinensis var. sinensis TaxID=542762 RepID=A0A4S4DZL0_CAMSN|nr:hypothetical protein TEA_015823 [Camellia sinensis var. sinensis]
MLMAILLSLSPHPPNPPQNPNLKPKPKPKPKPISLSTFNTSKRHFVFHTASLCFLSLTLHYPIPISLAEKSPSKSILSGIANTKSWFQFYGSGFAIRVPPQFEDIMEPEDYNAGLSLYGDKAKPKTFAARFASSDGSEVLSVVIRPSNQLKITFLEVSAAKLMGATRYACLEVIKSNRYLSWTYYFYEFGRDQQHVALVATVNSGKVFIAGATGPQSKWDDDGVKLRSAAVSLTVL